MYEWVGGCLHEPVIVNVCNDFLRITENIVYNVNIT